MKKYTLSIPAPCSVPLQDMPRTELGRFCHNCQQQVVDFSNMSDKQVIAYFEKHGPCCGKFNAAQLDREIVVATQNRKWLPAAVFAGMLAVVLPETGQAQQRQVTGVVMDSVSGTPIPGATMIIKATKITTHTNEKGVFVLQIPENYTTEFKILSSSIGYQSKEIQITNETLAEPIQVKLQGITSDDLLAGYVVVAHSVQTARPKNWWQRMKRKLFR